MTCSRYQPAALSLQLFDLSPAPQQRIDRHRVVARFTIPACCCRVAVDVYPLVLVLRYQLAPIAERLRVAGQRAIEGSSVRCNEANCAVIAHEDRWRSPPLSAAEHRAFAVSTFSRAAPISMPHFQLSQCAQDCVAPPPPNLCDDPIRR
jgi:hypothetical protein